MRRARAHPCNSVTHSHAQKKKNNTTTPGSLTGVCAVAATDEHTIVLVQLTKKATSRTYSDFESVGAAMDGVCKLYEQRLQQLNPGVKQITYDIRDLYNFVDNLADISCLTLNSRTRSYVPHDRAWVKDQLLARLRVIAH